MNRNIEPIISTVFIPIRPTQKGLQGFANLTINNQLALNGIGIYSRPLGDGYRLVFPINKNVQNETYYFCPVDRDFGDLLTKAVTLKIDEIRNRKAM